MARYHNKNWERARKHFNIQGQPDMVLHHKDETLKETDFARYLEWRPEDLEAIPKGEHTRIHHKGKVYNEETRARMRATHKGFEGHHHTPETIALIKSKTKGVPKSEVTRERIRKNHAHLSGENSPNSKTVLCVETGEIFKGAVTAARKIGIYPSGITRCCQGIKKTAGGYHWRYSDD